MSSLYSNTCHPLQEEEEEEGGIKLRSDLKVSWWEMLMKNDVHSLNVKRRMGSIYYIYTQLPRASWSVHITFEISRGVWSFINPNPLTSQEATFGLMNDSWRHIHPKEGALKVIIRIFVSHELLFCQWEWFHSNIKG